MSSTQGDSRLTQMMAWAEGIEVLSGLSAAPASADASFRRYFRFANGEKSFIVMDAPPQQEDCEPFIRVAGYLESFQLNAPRVLEADLEQGFLLLSDLGTQSYLAELERRPQSVNELYSDALTALLQMQVKGAACQSNLPPYDVALLERELALFSDWLCGDYLQLSLSNEEQSEWNALCQRLIRNALDQPPVFVHRDYHSRNLMVSVTHNPGIIDFQDAVEGPLTYDLVSLLKDCYIRWPAEAVRAWARQFYAQLDNGLRTQLDERTFMRHFEFTGVQRHLKAAGIFARLNLRDGKPGYMQDIPRTLGYVRELGHVHSELEFIARFIDERVLPALEAAA
ncbi:MAG: phosphotransferase [Pseudomonadota bacterium]